MLWYKSEYKKMNKHKQVYGTKRQSRSNSIHLTLLIQLIGFQLTGMRNNI